MVDQRTSDQRTSEERAFGAHKGACGKYHYYHVGKCQYIVTDGPQGKVVGEDRNLSGIFQKAARLDAIAKAIANEAQHVK
jgi:hypothetical protein